MGNFLILKNLLESKLFLSRSPQRKAEWKTCQQENVTVKEQSKLITQDEMINVESDKMNEVGKFICTL